MSVYSTCVCWATPASSVAVLTTYNGQTALLRDVFQRRCAAHPAFGMPSKVGMVGSRRAGTGVGSTWAAKGESHGMGVLRCTRHITHSHPLPIHPPTLNPQIATVDKFQGQQADYVLLSLVRTAHFGHLRDVRRLVVAMSRSRRLYVSAAPRSSPSATSWRPPSASHARPHRPRPGAPRASNGARARPVWEAPIPLWSCRTCKPWPCWWRRWWRTGRLGGHGGRVRRRRAVSRERTAK